MMKASYSDGGGDPVMIVVVPSWWGLGRAALDVTFFLCLLDGFHTIVHQAKPNQTE
jgi:hypothetical protein